MKTMSITIDEQLYSLLKRTAGPRGMSQFISRVLREKLRSTQKSLYREYLAAKEDRDRQKVLSDWDALENEGWR